MGWSGWGVLSCDLMIDWWINNLRCNNQELEKARIYSAEHWQPGAQKPVYHSRNVLMRKWVWIDHTLRKATTNITRQTLTWNPQGKREREPPLPPWKKKQLAMRHGGSIEEDGMHLNKGYKNSASLSSLVKCCWWPKLHLEWRAFVKVLCPDEGSISETSVSFTKTVF